MLVTVPLVAVVAFAGLALVTTAGQALRADGLRALVAVAAAGGDLAHELQAERAAAVAVLAPAAGAAEQPVPGAQRAEGFHRCGVPVIDRRDPVIDDSGRIPAGGCGHRCSPPQRVTSGR